MAIAFIDPRLRALVSATIVVLLISIIGLMLAIFGVFSLCAPARPPFLFSLVAFILTLLLCCDSDGLLFVLYSL